PGGGNYLLGAWCLAHIRKISSALGTIAPPLGNGVGHASEEGSSRPLGRSDAPWLAECVTLDCAAGHRKLRDHPPYLAGSSATCCCSVPLSLANGHYHWSPACSLDLGGPD